MAKKRRLKRNIRTKSLDTNYNTRVRREFLDADYLHTLDPNSYEYMLYAQFIDEYYGAAISKGADGRIKPGHLHNTRALAKDCYKKNNDRNNDVYGVSKANGKVDDIIPELQKNDGWYVHNEELTEDSLNAEIDAKNSGEDILTKKEFLRFKKKMDKGEATMTPEMLLFYLEYYDIDLDDL